jgi:glucosyl-3-phosphoglycerate synthase
MSDFLQDNHITTFHSLGSMMSLEKLEADLRKFTPGRPIALLIPSLFSELEGEALPAILEELKSADYIKRIVVSLDRANRDEFNHAKKFFRQLPQNLKIVWNDGPKMKSVMRLLDKHEIPTGPQGKGRGAWLAFGYVLSKRDTFAIALHDADIVTYDRQMLARLIFPVVHPGCDFEFSKGFYSRISQKMHGRVTRLLVFPLIQALSLLIARNDYIRYLRAFRYPLAGEFAIVNNLVRRCRLPYNWGLEIGVLSEVYRNSSKKRICQVDLADLFDHKHSNLVAGDMKGGLGKMAVDIILMLFSTLASMGNILNREFFNTLSSTYLRTAQEFITKYDHDSLINGLEFDRHAEGVAVETFRECLTHACEQFLDNPFEVQSIPTWNRVVAAIPSIFEKLEAAVEEDNKK